MVKHHATHALAGLERYKAIAPTILRVVIGIFFIAHGAMKIFGGMQGTAGFFGSLGIPVIFAYLVGYGEFIGGIFLVVGFLTRYVSIYLGIVMVFAFSLTKIGKGFLAGETDIAFLAILISLLFTGPGKWSLDALCKKKKHV